MSRLRIVLREVVSLFVDDRGLAVGILCLLLLARLLSYLHPPGMGWSGLLLFAGLACLLVGTTLRRARNG